MSNKQKRLHLIDEYKRIIESLPFKTLDGDDLIAKDVYICPLCLKSYNLEESLDVLTMEDVPPKSLGGKPILITCKKCNNTCGHKLDVFLFNEFKYFEDIKSLGENGKSARLSINGIEVNARIKEKEDKTLYCDIGNNNNPATLRMFLENIEMAGNNWKIDAKIKLSNLKRNENAAKLAVLKSAYLLAFYKLGYRYILNSNLSIVRDMLINPEQMVEKSFIVADGKSLNPKIKDDVYLAKINDIKAIIVVLSLRMNPSNHMYRYAVALPSHGEIEKNLYENVLSFDISNKNLHIEFLGPAKITINN